MCESVVFTVQSRDKTVSFKERLARLPVVKRDGSLSYVTWGRRLQEAGELPLGGWARLEAIQRHVWDPWQPRPVKIAVKHFIERDFSGELHWQALTPGQYVQGLLAQIHQEVRVYVVTILPDRMDAIFPRWPQIIWHP